MTKSIEEAISETKRRREIQIAYNKLHNITPKTIIKPVKKQTIAVTIKDTKYIPRAEIPNMIIELNSEMQNAAESLEFEKAIEIRDKIKDLEKRIGENSALTN